MGPVQDWDEWLDRSNKAAIQFVTIEITMASTLLDRAEMSSDAQAGEQARKHARLAFDTASSILPRLRLSLEEESAMTGSLGRIQHRLQGSGAAGEASGTTSGTRTLRT